MSKRPIIGIKLRIPPRLINKNTNYEEFIKGCKCVAFETDFDDLVPLNRLECKYYDDETGEIYFHFTHPVERQKILEDIFEEDELIRELEN